MAIDLVQYRNEIAQELDAILNFWITHCVDERNGGFIGRMDHQNRIDPDAPKGSVLNSRILWTFSAAARYTGSDVHRAIADRAFTYLQRHFIDPEWGGVYWSVNAGGQPLDTKKQIYALAFAIYAFSEYYRLTANGAALDAAKDFFALIETHSYDGEHGGYIEAMAPDWQPLADLRLSAKDSNEKKSMNTHLHVLEAYANLYRVWPDALLCKRLVTLVRHFLDHIIHPHSGHLQLFFNESWEPRSAAVSYGHDIEAAWLVQEAAAVIGNEDLITEVKTRSLQVAEAAARGLDVDGGLWYEKDGEHLVKEKHWWPQAEAMVGFFNAWQLTGDAVQLERSVNNWRFVQQHIIHRDLGEWIWGVREDYSPMPGEDKVGIWKCNYHNGRACIELLHRMDGLIKA
ncbi:AGE family epimerase/isomerase [Paracnuella aquatica]|uniref:AGE family epimerase/isomerase n=1 Tax=Paracnuella aquatica TaxID=2268757 RepID=UPI000DEFE849|nr:AGE family epimerase/isomerase [Paracnuella aquatica]RPD44003.1 N-acyl-D-glucosamine 2-epimerase [Paracnuella aquatica]